MTLKQFIRENKEDIDIVIEMRTEGRNINTDLFNRYNNRERELWVKNDQALYLWAKDSGVKLP